MILGCPFVILSPCHPAILSKFASNTMNSTNLGLDQPQGIEHNRLDSTSRYQLANQEISFAVDAETDLLDLVWPWTGEIYARSIRMKISDPRDEPLIPIITRYYPGYQEVILGSEGMIVSKRLTVPLKSSFDRAVIWLLECQVEGDRLLRLEIDIDWGEPLTQRMVDGLLVAQRNPGEARGLYGQSNAERTCVFGNPYGRPDSIDIETSDRAHLVYHVLVNGMVEVPLLLTISDVGEQVAWNGFLALRDTERAYELTVKAWNVLVKTGRLWTPDMNFNAAVQSAKLATARNLQRLRSGLAPADRQIDHLPALVASLDTLDVTESRNLLAHVRRTAEASAGRLPRLLPMRPKEALADPGGALLETNGAYLTSLYHHLQHHGDADLLAAHYVAVQLCVEVLIKYRVMLEDHGEQLTTLGVLLRQALDLAIQQKNGADAVRWESEACEAERLAKELHGQKQLPIPGLDDWPATSTWQTPTDQPWHFADQWAGVALAGNAVWQGCGISQRGGEVWVQPALPTDWLWWAVLDLPIGTGKLSLLWDGATLHATQPVRSLLPVQVQQRIRAQGVDEDESNLEFELKWEVEGIEQRQVFKPARQQLGPEGTPTATDKSDASADAVSPSV